MKPVLGVIADDLTGGLETAAMLVALGVHCDFVTNPDLVGSMEGFSTAVVAQKTRVTTSAYAVERSEAAARALLDAGCRQLFFKYCATFDSTDKGNIGPVADRLLELTNSAYTAFCPGSVEVGRSVVNGYLFAGDVLVSESFKRFDPLTPMLDPNLVRVLQRQSIHKVGLLPHKLVRQGGEALKSCVSRLFGDGVRHMIADSLYDEDLDAIAKLTVDWPLMTGNAAIVQFYPALWRARGWLAPQRDMPPLAAVDGPGVVLAGSCSEQTLAQLQAFGRDRPVYRIDLAKVGHLGAIVADVLEWSVRLIDDGPVAIATSSSPEGVASAQSRHGREGAAKLAEAIMGTLAVALREKGVRRFMIAGGETSGVVVQSMGIERLNVGAYTGPGLGCATSIGPDPAAFSLKSGKLGHPDLFLSMLEEMRAPGRISVRADD